MSHCDPEMKRQRPTMDDLHSSPTHKKAEVVKNAVEVMMTICYDH